MQTAIVTRPQTASAATLRVSAGRVTSIFAILFMLFDGVTKVLQVPAVLQAAAQLGFGASATVGIGLLALACTALYTLPRTTLLGALLLTGYLGGAVAIQVRLGAPLFSVLFPILFGVLVWGGVALRDRRVRALFAA
jgi:DoxX-like family